ncbi:hypothetical protein DFH09DRAFT_617961 [Mycena vulgaris]|nr:hypothetical protein DFH09DRAFT_617961 [Mycena vulgaris]
MSEGSEPSEHTPARRRTPTSAPAPPSTPNHVYALPNQYFTPGLPYPYYQPPFSPATPGSAFIYHQPAYAYPVSSPFPQLAPAPGPAMPASGDRGTDSFLADLAIAFAGDFFNGIIPETRSHHQKRVFEWPIAGVTTEDRLLVVIRAIRKAGFPTIGSFLAALFERKYNRHSSVYCSVAAFLRGAEDNSAHHPVAIVDLIFCHGKSQRWVDGIAEEPSFSLPRHALRPSLRLDRNLIPPGSNSTRNGLINWALQRILERADKEANLLVDPIHGFVRLPGMEGWSWEMVLTSWSMVKSEETIATVAPAIFAVGTTVAVNSRTRKKLEREALGVESSPSGPDPVSTPDAGNGQPASATLAAGTRQSVSQELPFYSVDSGGGPSPHESSRESEPEPEPDAGSDGEEEEPTSSSPTSPLLSKIGRRDPWQAVTSSILVLLYFRYRFALIFPMLIGLFAFTCNANRDLVSLLCRLGLAVSYQTTLATLHVLATDSDAQLKLLGAFDIDRGPGFLLLFDNVNKMQRAWQAVLGHKDEVKSGTASTVIEVEDVPPGAMRSEPLMEKIKQKVRLKLTVKQLRDDINWPHIRGVGVGTVLRIWLKYLPSLSHHRAAVEALFNTKHAKHRLRLRKSKIHTPRPTNIDEATTVGVGNVLWNLVIGQLFMLPVSLFKWMIMVCGDQLSIDRLRKIIRYTAKGDTPFEQHQWVLPIIQLWHLKWAWQKAIFRLHWYPDLDKGTLGLHHDCVVLEREKFNHEKCDFYPAHHILEDRFEALILDALRLRCEEETNQATAPGTKLIDSLGVYFDAEGPLSDCSFEQLHEFATAVYDRYMCAAAADDALGHTPRDVNIYGQPWSGDSVDDEPEALPKTSTPSLKKKAKRSRTTAGAKPARNFSKGDQALVTLCNFMRVTFWYMELCAATAEGDIGRVFEVIKLLRFSFWGAGSTNYGNELLELACNFLYEFSDDLVTAVLNNYLVNPSGRIGHWLELDLLQEHFNFWIKRLFNAKSHDFDSKHLSEAVGLNIAGISKLREVFPGLFGLQRNGQRHKDANTIHDINKLGIHFRKNHVLEYDAGRDQPYQVGNEFGVGHAKLLNGQLATFLARTAGGGSATGEEESEPDASAEPTLPELPATPVTVCEGVMDVGEFLTGE